MMILLQLYGKSYEITQIKNYHKGRDFTPVLALTKRFKKQERITTVPSYFHLMYGTNSEFT